MKLTQEEKRIKLAESCPFVHKMDRQFVWLSNGRWVEFDPFNDLNAVHELEKLLSDSEWDKYGDCLDSIRNPVKNWIHATATQRAEALGKTLNLW